jgi:regulator of extracellular matrix RemA (YlzA/DUF370 family)
MCEDQTRTVNGKTNLKTVRVTDAIGMVLAHDITEIRRHEFKGRAFRKGHIVRQEDICHLRRLGKEHLFVLSIGDDEIHEDAASIALASVLMGGGVAAEGEPREGKINIIATRDGLLKIDKNALYRFNMLADVMCATLHNNTIVGKGEVVAGTRAIPLVVKREIVKKAVEIAKDASGVIEVKEMRKPRAGVVITGNEIYHGGIQDAFAPIIAKKIEEFNGEIVGIYYAPDDELFIEARMRELIGAGSDLIIATGGMSVDPDDVTRFAIRGLGATHMTYGSAVIPGAMFLIGYIERDQRSRIIAQEASESSLFALPPDPIPILCIPACGLYHKTTVFDLILPRVLAGERIGRRELAELGHGGLCLHCRECRFPHCPFGR